MEHKIYARYALTENEVEKGDINYTIFNELKSKYKIKAGNNSNGIFDFDEYDIIIEEIETAQKRKKFRVVRNLPNLSTLELMLIADSGNLCFGGGSTSYKVFDVYTD